MVGRPVLGLIGSVVLVIAALEASTQSPAPPPVLPGMASTALAQSLKAASAHRSHLWRDTPAMNDDGTVNAYIEIPRGVRRKWEFDMRENDRALDRTLPAEIGGYPVNYGFVPQTVSYDGDPFDALVLGPPLPGGRFVRGVIVGLMLMEDEKGLDSKVVLALPGPSGRPAQVLRPDEQHGIAEFFRKYKMYEPDAFSRVPGWGTSDDGLAHIQMTHAFFKTCRTQAARACRVEP
jgi:inorganic pyrophosphatase